MKVYIIEIQTDLGFWEKVGVTAYKDYKAAEQVLNQLVKKSKEMKDDFTFRISYLVVK